MDMVKRRLPWLMQTQLVGLFLYWAAIFTSAEVGEKRHSFEVHRGLIQRLLYMLSDINYDYVLIMPSKNIEATVQKNVQQQFDKIIQLAQIVTAAPVEIVQNPPRTKLCQYLGENKSMHKLKGVYRVSRR